MGFAVTFAYKLLTSFVLLPLHTRIQLRGLQFPYNFELTFNNLLFPLTKETWEKDNRAFDDLGISALLDLDGKFSTANENDLLGFGISKPVAIAGSQVRDASKSCQCCEERDKQANKYSSPHYLQQGTYLTLIYLYLTTTK
jgi:hypothetical protein